MKRLALAALALLAAGCHHSDPLLTGCQLVALTPTAQRRYYQRHAAPIPEPVPFPAWLATVQTACRLAQSDRGGDVTL